MADILTGAIGGRRRRLTTPRVDLTPMVDLGFLLITFFMYTTTLARPKVMELTMPDRAHVASEPPAIPAEATIVLLPAAHHRIAWYRGTDEHMQDLHWCTCSGNEDLRGTIRSEIMRVAQLPANFSREAHKLHVLIRPDTAASYDDIVRVLDEMTINAVPHYTMMRITSDEQLALKKSLQPVVENE